MKKRIQVKTEKPQFTVITNLTYAQRDSWFGHTMQDLKMDRTRVSPFLFFLRRIPVE